MELNIVEVVRPEGMLVRPVGALVTETAPLLHERLLALLARSPRTMVLALDQLMELDATGVSALVAVNRRAGLMGTDLRMAEPRDNIAQRIETDGLDRVFSMYPTVDAALKTEPTAIAG